MREYTLQLYKEMITAIKSNYNNIIRFDDYLRCNQKPSRFCIIRHDVDRKPGFALEMAKLESSLGVKAAYYFRASGSSFKPYVIQQIHSLGHEIGYHYESLSAATGDINKALIDFEENLSNFRKIVPVSTISMHGRPFSKFDNRDMWKNPGLHARLREQYHLLGEVYLDVNYEDVLYLSDTGRNWTSRKNNFRDTVISNIDLEFSTSIDLLYYLQGAPHPKLVFQIHPERWTDNLMQWYLQYINDVGVNFAKSILRGIR
jgi:hypothetical protein